MTPIILGPTGSGKSAIGLQLARELNGEIISADSRAIYQGLDIGTAKPTSAEQELVPHHGLDLVQLGERFTVADWKSYAEQKITEIESRHHFTLIVGGTGLYIDALIFDYHFHGPTGAKINDFEQKSCSDRKEVKGNFLLIGLDAPREELRDRLHQRIDQMFTTELFEEYKNFVQPVISPTNPTLTLSSDPAPASSPAPISASSLTSASPPASPAHSSTIRATSSADAVFARAGNIYRFVAAYLNGELTLDEAKTKAFYADYHLAKRQLTWFKRNPAIHWLSPKDVIQFVHSVLK